MKIGNLRTLKGPGARLPDGGVRVDRQTPYGNPFVIGRDGDRAKVIEKHRAWLKRQLEDPDFRAMLIEDLGEAESLWCWCNPEPCHAENYIDALKEVMPAKHTRSRTCNHSPWRICEMNHQCELCGNLANYFVLGHGVLCGRCATEILGPEEEPKTVNELLMATVSEYSRSVALPHDPEDRV